jgi:hypothetical protein
MEMNRKAVLSVILANLAFLLALAFVYPHLMISPGKLIDAHLELTTDCFACHTPFLGSTPEKCIVCHKVDEIGLVTTKGLPIAGEKKGVAFHQKLVEDDCVACHSDHKGVKAFRPIGQFSHALLDPSLEKQCDGCHGSPGDALHQKIVGNCGQCHTQDAWTPATFDHDQYFRFDQNHTTECVTCHIDNDYGKYTCYGCHEHSRSKIREEHVEEGIYDYENCVECHRSGDEHEAELLWRAGRLESDTGESFPSGSRSHRDGGRREHDDD